MQPSAAHDEDNLPAHYAAWSLAKKQQFAEYIQQQEELGRLHERRLASRVANGQTAVVVHGDGGALCTMAKGKRIGLGRKWQPCEAALDVQWGSTFRIERGQPLLQEPSASLELDADSQQYDADFVPSMTNENLKRDAPSQKLTEEQISELKKTSSGMEIVQTLIQHSETFSQKSEFSREKYLKRKKRKYLQQFQVLEAQAFRVARKCFEVLPKTRPIRDDTIAQILCLGQVAAGRCTLVLDEVGGFVAAACAQRQGGMGQVFYLYEHKKLLRSTSRFLNLTPAEQQCLRPFCTSQIIKIFTARKMLSGLAAAEKQSSMPQPQQEQGRQEGHDLKVADTGAGGSDPQPNQEGAAPSVGRKRRHPDPSGPITQADLQAYVGGADFSVSARTFVNSGCDTLILASPMVDPVQTLSQLLPLVKPGGTFVVYSPFVQLLAEAREGLRRANVAAYTHITETLYEIQQVLPGRTHPMMNGVSSGGYLLSGYRVRPS